MVGENMEHIEIKDKSGWHLFWKAAAITAIAIGLIAIGFFGAMLVAKFWA